MPSPAVLAAHLDRLRRAPSPFYRDRLDGRDLDELPLTRRGDLLRDQLAHLPHGTRRCADAALPTRVGATGTGPELLLLAWSPQDLEREIAAGVRVLGRLGAAAGTRVANNLRGALCTPGALLLGDVVEHLGGLDVPLGTTDGEGAARQAWTLLDLVEPSLFVLDPATAAVLLAAAPPRERPWWRGIVWLRLDGAPPPDVPAPAGFRGTQRTWLAVPEATSFVAHSCDGGRFHVDEGVHAEVVDGELVLTPLGADDPVLRYASGVRARPGGGSCPCGVAGPTLLL